MPCYYKFKKPLYSQCSTGQVAEHRSKVKGAEGPMTQRANRPSLKSVHLVLINVGSIPGIPRPCHSEDGFIPPNSKENDLILTSMLT